jgi:hypothetical protein
MDKPTNVRAPPRLLRRLPEGPSADSQQDHPQSRTRHGLLTLVAMMVITCVSIAWGLATLECPTGKDRWGACNR